MFISNVRLFHFTNFSETMQMSYNLKHSDMQCISVINVIYDLINMWNARWQRLFLLYLLYIRMYCIYLWWCCDWFWCCASVRCYLFQNGLTQRPLLNTCLCGMITSGGKINDIDTSWRAFGSDTEWFWALVILWAFVCFV